MFVKLNLFLFLLSITLLYHCDSEWQPFTCENGTPFPGRSREKSTEICRRCEAGYRYTDSTGETDCDPLEKDCVCSPNLYLCENGTPIKPVDGSRPETHETIIQCDSCNVGYALIPVDEDAPDGAKKCFGDADADDIANAADSCPNGMTGWISAQDTDQDRDGCRDSDEDVDDDNDGLIDINNVNEAANVRHNPDGTSLDDEEDDGAGNFGDIRGAPLRPTANCKGEDHDDNDATPLVGIDHDDNDATPRIFLCGYELTRDLDFANNNSYANPSNPSDKNTWCPTANTCKSDSGAGFPGLGENFNAIFHGNGHSISHLYMRTSGNVGLFRSTGSNAIIKQIGLKNAHIYGSRNNDEKIGALVGLNTGVIAASHATTSGGGTSSVNGGGNTPHDRSRSDRIGGLVGWNNGGGKIIASYAKVTANSAGSFILYMGGLVGQNNGWIIASYATGNVNSLTASVASVDSVGGLVGRNGDTVWGGTAIGIIRASYATGNVTDSGGGVDDLGGLVGYASQTDVRASYATGNVSDTDDDSNGQNQDLVGKVVGTSYTVFGGLQRRPHRWVVKDRNIIQNYGFGDKMGHNGRSDGDRFFDGDPPSCGSQTCTVNTLTLTEAGDQWDSAQYGTKGAWDFGDANTPPKLKYSDYDGPTGTDYDLTGPAGNFNIDCAKLFPAGACASGGRLIPGQ